MSEYMCSKCGYDLDTKDEECPMCNGEVDEE
jgi:rubrerythrin